MKHTLIGRNERFLIAVEKAGQAAKSDYPLLIVGETGVGKNALAEYIHRESDRRNRPFIHINCASIPENLMESELFGHEKGAFTGASKRKKGKIELADGGTLFLDEISCLSPLAQAKLLTFLDEYQFTRVGGLENISVDVRVVCATNANLPARIEEGRFRKDLYNRLNVILIYMPPLRERKDDIIMIAKYFVKRYGEEQGKEGLILSDDAKLQLASYDWPGNVRELENVIKRAVVACKGEEIKPEDLGIIGRVDALRLEKMERQHIVSVLRLVRWRRKRAAEILGISYNTLKAKMEKYKIEPKDASYYGYGEPPPWCPELVCPMFH